MNGRKGNLTWNSGGIQEEPGGQLFEKESRQRDNRCGVDSRTAWTCAPCKIVSQLRHNHVVPALTGRCICV